MSCTMRQCECEYVDGGRRKGTCPECGRTLYVEFDEQFDHPLAHLSPRDRMDWEAEHDADREVLGDDAEYFDMTGGRDVGDR